MLSKIDNFKRHCRLYIILLLVIFLLQSYSLNPQTWHKQIFKELEIDFPILPDNKVIDYKGKEAYICSVDGCSFMVAIILNVLEKDEQYLDLPENKQIAISLNKMEGIALGKIKSKNQYLISLKSFRFGKYNGLDVEYATLEPSNPDSRKRYSTLILINNTLYVIDCWYLDDKDHEIEKRKFFDSIKIKAN